MLSVGSYNKSLHCCIDSTTFSLNSSILCSYLQGNNKILNGRYSLFVYWPELAPGTFSLTCDWAKDDDSKQLKIIVAVD